jgi:hypothetical protein
VQGSGPLALSFLAKTASPEGMGEGGGVHGWRMRCQMNKGPPPQAALHSQVSHSGYTVAGRCGGLMEACHDWCCQASKAYIWHLTSSLQKKPGT